MSPRPCLLLLGLAACIIENPAFKSTGAGDSADDTTAAATGEPTTTTAGPTSTTGADATADADASTDATGDPDTTGESSTGDATIGEACVPELMDDPCVPLSINGRNYLRCEEHLDWAAADTRCRQRCARLVVFPPDPNPDKNPHSDQLMAALRSLMTDADKQEEQLILTMQLGLGQSPNALWWIGGRRFEGAWTWVDGTPMPPAGMFGWAPGDPEPLPDKDQDCAVLAVFGADQYNGRWFDRSCNGMHRYLCERPG